MISGVCLWCLIILLLQRKRIAVMCMVVGMTDFLASTFFSSCRNTKIVSFPIYRSHQIVYIAHISQRFKFASCGQFNIKIVHIVDLVNLWFKFKHKQSKIGW